ncbi:MAG TPA: DUF2313 domain-containing protein, partial [Candidatus Faecivivens stercorigallinarum]|nr:DUF2313 domain-containing protein [Candidatus Faecivivens stercorigallinarum]
MRQLIDYLPPVMAELLEMQGITSAVQPQIDALWNETEYLLDELYIPYASGIGLKRWEKLLGLPSSGSVEKRRQEILLVLQSRLPYTETFLKDYLEEVLGDVILTVDYGQYSISIEAGSENEEILSSLSVQLRQIISANMALFLAIMEEYLAWIYTGCLLQVT